MPPHGLKGHCKLCASKWLPDINRMLDEGWNAREIGDWVASASKGALTFTRQTLYTHRDNTGGQHKRGATAAPATTSPGPRDTPDGEPTGPAPRSSNDEFLEFIRDHSMQELREHPDLITPKMGMEAVKILEARKDRNPNVIVLARILTNQIPTQQEPEVVVGEYHEVLPPAEVVGIETSEGANQQ